MTNYPVVHFDGLSDGEVVTNPNYSKFLTTFDYQMTAFITLSSWLVALAALAEASVKVRPTRVAASALTHGLVAPKGIINSYKDLD